MVHAMDRTENQGKITIPAPLYRKLEDRIKGSEFASVSDYVIFVLKELLAEEEGGAMSGEDEAKIKERLRALGYMD